jgi:peptidoglycan/LPS O-acetylase OafA/YrhL
VIVPKETPSVSAHVISPIGDKRIPSLDGLRAVSIVLVLWGHEVGVRNFPYKIYGDLGHLGVRIFFVVSGFLITSLLLHEHAKYGRISIKNFYARRTLRIFPAFYAYVGAISILGLLGILKQAGLELTNYDRLYALTYSVNYFGGQSHAIRHLWSLSVEEQFYVLWSTLLFIAGRTRGIWLAGMMILVGPVIRLLSWYFLPGYRLGIDFRFETVADALATGCVLAGVHQAFSASPKYQKLLTSKLFWLVPLVVYFCCTLENHPLVFFGVAETIMNIGIALCIDRYVRYPYGYIGRFLNWRPVCFAGAMSYSIYLWQQIFLVPGTEAWFAVFPANLVLTTMAGLGSYFLVERPFLKLKSHFKV